MLNKYFSLVKFSHTIFALPFALVGFTSGLYLGDIPFSWRLLIFVILCMVFARSAAMAFNRYLDRDIDSRNARTVDREIPAGVIQANHALFFVIACCFGFILTTYFINTLCFVLSPVALLVILGYSYTKRFTALCHIVLGIGLALAPIGAYMAVTGTLHPSMLFYGLAVFTWVAGFDIIYALQDDAFDKSQGLHSIPADFGRAKALSISTYLHFVTALAIGVAGYSLLGSNLFTHYLHLIAIAIFIGLLYYQHTLVKPNDLTKVDRAFFTTNGMASLTFGALFIVDIFLANQF